MSAAFDRYRRAIEKMFVADDPDARRFFATVQVTDDPRQLFWNRPIADMDRDGADELLVERWRYTLDPIGFGMTGDYRAQVLDGHSGSLLWTYKNEFHGGFPLLAMQIELNDGPGLLFPKLDNQSAESPTYRLTLDAVDKGGQEVWQRVFTTTYNLATGAYGATDVPLTFERIQADEDDTTEFLVATMDYVRSALPERAVVVSEVSILDADDGSMDPHGTVGPDPRWFHSIQAGTDIDGGGQDIVIAGESDRVSVDGEIDASFVEARSSSSGEILWRTETPLRWHAWAGGVPDMTGDGARDLVVGWDDPDSGERFFQVWDASSGRPLWKYRGTFPYLAGDIDGDGSVDLGAYRFISDEKRAGARFLAFSKGETLYAKAYTRTPPDCDGGCFSSGFYLNGGDIDGDSLRDTYVIASYPTPGKPIVDEYAVSGGTGGMLYRERGLAPIRGSIDGRGDDLIGFERAGAGVLRIRAVDGSSNNALWEGTYDMPGVKDLGPYGAYGTATELDGSPGAEVIVTFSGKASVTLVALDGSTGRILWQRPLEGKAPVRAQ